MRLWRAASPTGPFSIVATITQDGTSLYPEDGLTSGVTYDDKAKGTGLLGEESASSYVFSGTPEADPIGTRDGTDPLAPLLDMAWSDRAASRKRG